jgi:hypothetical protein
MVIILKKDNMSFREWLKEKEMTERNILISFQNFFVESDETAALNESVITKIKKIFLLKDADSIVKNFKDIFSIKDDIKISKINIGGANLDTLEITYSSLSTLIHELIHYLQLRAGVLKDIYSYPEYTNCGILRYMLQPLELNNWAISLACESLQYNSFDDFLKISEELPIDKFENANKTDRLKHCLHLLTHNMNCDKKYNIRKQYKEKLLKLAKQYSLVIKSLNKDITEHYVKEIVDIL